MLRSWKNILRLLKVIKSLADQWLGRKDPGKEKVNHSLENSFTKVRNLRNFGELVGKGFLNQEN